jgi:predicted nucleic acid-binding protein
VIVVDTSVWSLVLRRRRPAREHPSARALQEAIADDQTVLVPGIVLHELLAGLREAAQARRLAMTLEGFSLMLASRDDHVAAARIHSACARRGVTAGTVDCLIAAQTIAQEARLLTTDADFNRIAAHCDLRLVDT